MRRRFLNWTVPALAALVVATLLAPSVGAAPAKKKKPPIERVTCGQTIDKSVRVGNGLDCPGSDALIVGAHGITVDLNGHRLSGTFDGAGIRNDGFDQVKVRNGVITRFDVGVALENVRRNVVAKVLLDRNGTSGIRLSSSNDNVLRGNAVLRTCCTDGSNGIDLVSSHGNVLKKNTLTENEAAGVALLSSSDNRLVRNVAAVNRSHGIALFSSDSNHVTRNRSSGNDVSGVRLSGSDGNSVANNRTTANFDGISVESSSSNRLKGNQASQNRRGGIEVLGAFGENVMTSNKAHENGEHGIVSDDTLATIKANSAHRNGFFDGEADLEGLGISASEGTQGGGNKAKDNDDPMQCVPSALCL